MKKFFSIALVFLFTFALVGCDFDVEGLNTTLAGLQESLDDLEDQATDNQAQIDTLTGNLTTAQASITSMAAEIAALEAELATANAALAAANAALVAQEALIDDIVIPVVPTFTLNLNGLTLPGGELSEDLTLPTITGGEIVWVSSDTSVLTSEGKVIRPSATRGNVDVMLTAVVLQGNLAAKKSFTFTVPALGMTDAEKVLAALDAIDIPAIATEDVNLPKEVAGAVLFWETSKPAYLATSGKVVRPHFDFSDEEVELTAYVTSGKELRIFKQNVVVKKMAYAIHGSVGNPFVVTLSNVDGHTIYVPVENIDRPTYTANEEFPYIYTPEFGARIPATINGWGYALQVAGDGTVLAYYDGLNGKKWTAAGEEAMNAQHFAKDPASCTTPGDWATCGGLTIPEDGYVFLFQNTGASNKNNRTFGYTYFRDNTFTKKITIEGLTTEPSKMYFEILGGVWWRGNVKVWVPKAFINPNLAVYADAAAAQALYNQAVVLQDPADVGSDQVAGAPFIFTNSYNTTAGVAKTSLLDIKNGWGIAAEITPEVRKIQTIGDEPNLIDVVLDNPWMITRVYDGIGGTIKNMPPTPNTPVAGGDYAKNIVLPSVGYVIVFPGTQFAYGSNQDVLNRRIGADYFYHLENWIYSPVLVEKDALQAPLKSAWE